MKHGGDDLEDDFILDDIVALSGDEAPGDAQLEDEDIFVDDGGQTPEEEDDTDETGPTVPTSSSNDPQSTASAKKRKRREKEKERKVSSSEVLEAAVALTSV
jgi:protein CMS1